MKIVGVDNYNRDSVPDILIAENVQLNWAEEIVALLNKKHQSSDTFYKVKPDDYRLSRGMEDLV